ncbi:MAG TPA: VIT1/CCC1 transporter family protein [Polyangia bacterium]|jgi:VIT1/CCC1 family predicted Fe2+/Mn2+ transporter|nr:VIT1/CCC1 transporter family protein [Polyangia bacterium]
MNDDSPAPPPHDPALHFHNYVDPHHHESRLRDIILGGQDGLVNVLGVILGVAAATQDVRVVLAAGLAAALAESVSMGAVAYTSTQAQRALYQSEHEREHRHIDRVPQLERSEIRELYRKKGFSGPLLERIVETITADPEVWVAVMMSEELKLTPVSTGDAWRAALVVGVSAIVGSLLPLVPFLALPMTAAIAVSLGVTALTLFAVGAYQAVTTVGHWLRSGLRLAAIGMASALVGYGVGALFKVPSGAGG